MPLVSTPATNRARTLRKRIPSLETGIAAVRQPQDSRPVYPGRRLLCCYLGRVSLSFHHRSFLRPWPFHQCQTRFLSLVFCRLCYNCILRRPRKQGHARVPSRSPDLFLKGNSIGHESTPRQECGPVLVISFLWRRRWTLPSIHLPVEDEFTHARGPAFAPARRPAP